jgi:catechol 2,3-dioxygenase-like lactoylglutathione lyase family enzyme
MKRIHVNLKVNSIEDSVQFYNAMFNQTPDVLKEDYAKWSVSDPSVNFSISLADEGFGLNHLGIETENEKELDEIYKRIEKAKGEVREEGHTICCYAQSEKSWIKDPQNVEWEAFHTYGSAEVNKVAQTDCCS